VSAEGERVAVVGFGCELAPVGDGRNDAELLAPAVDRALGESGLANADVGLVCSAGSEMLNGVVGTVMGAFEALAPAGAPRAHAHLEGDGAFALFEAWIRLLAGEADAALVCAYSRPLGAEPAGVLGLQLDPYVVGPLGPGPDVLAALQARALIDAGRCDERDLARIVGRAHDADVEELLRRPYVAPPLRDADRSRVCAGAAAIVLATGERAARAASRPAWVVGVDQRVDPHALGARDLTGSPSIRAAAAALGLPGTRVDVIEVHARYSHEEPIVLDAVGAEARAVNPSGGALAADPIMATGLIRVGEAAAAIRRGDAERAVAHATNGPCLQHNLLCVLEAG
jgi:hypothetical protein